MSSLRATMRELAGARIDMLGEFNSPLAADNLAAAGTLAAEAFIAYEAPRQGRVPRVSRATLYVLATQAMRGVE